MILQQKHAPVGLPFHDFDAGNRARSKELKQRGPAKGWPEAKQETILTIRTGSCRSGSLSQLSWRASVGLEKHRVKAPDTSEAGGDRHVPHRQGAPVDEPLGKMKAPGLSHGYRARSQIL